MKEVHILSPERYGFDFLAPEFIPPGADEYYLRNAQAGAERRSWRRLRDSEIEELVKNDNSCRDWNNLLVSDPFTPRLIKNNVFSGMVRLGRLEDVVLRHHDFELPAGITNSRVVACDIGDNCAVHNCAYISRYILGDEVMLSRIDEMQTTDHAKFGNGVVKQGESEDVRIWIDVMNEAGGRSILPFDGIIAADAYLWARYRDDAGLQRRLVEITQADCDARRGYYGTVGSGSVLKSNRIIKDVRIGECCYIKGANKLKNLTINSSAEEPTQIGEGVELVNGIIGYGCRVFYGCKAVRFVLGDNSSLKYGARLIHSVLGDNSTVSCCELLNNLIFPAHEQHHNNSFLVAALVKGQSNIAAGATLGSNHNSRANDGEISAGRGFWPGLAVTLKHSCRFASFTLLAKGDYPAELDIRLPFSLVNNNVHADRLEVLPAYWWLYNMYALARNAWKFKARDKRRRKVQHVEFSMLAPDTVEDILAARILLSEWIAEAESGAGSGPIGEIEVYGRDMEHSARPVLILRARRALAAYEDMVRWYAVTNLMEWMEGHPEKALSGMAEELGREPAARAWVNLGGQPVADSDVDGLREAIREGRLKSWSEIHAAYDRMWAGYPLARQRHAWAALSQLEGSRLAHGLNGLLWKEELEHAERIGRFIEEQVLQTRYKDYRNPFRTMTFRNEAEMEAVEGRIECNAFISQVRRDTEAFMRRLEALRARL